MPIYLYHVDLDKHAQQHMQKDVVEDQEPFHALHLFSIYSGNHMVASLFVFDQRICSHDLLKETFLAAKFRKDAQNTKALQELKIFSTF
jgi:hypothetical protein